MPDLLIGGALWLMLDAALLALWVVFANVRSRRAAALNSGHAEDPEIRHARRRAEEGQAELEPF
jgi:hypothetical protein